ncbi:hypothetical protein TNCV_137081 [Trichonephila clavipes]|nr:hypothetical protein TNCV_137081 [Trichonephila clavipes]
MQGCHTAWHRVINQRDGFLRYFLPNFLNCRCRTSTFPGRCSRLPVIFQACWNIWRSSDMAGQRSVLQACASNDNQRGSTDTPDHNSWLRACEACNDERRIGTLSWVFPDPFSMVAITEFERGIRS